MDLFDDNGATFSDDRKYRYVLWRIWSDAPKIMFIGLNPSTANETEMDPTITRVKGFATDWGYGGFFMMNLFAIVSKDPKVLKTDPNPLGDNDGWIEKISAKCDKIIFAWGAFKEAKERAVDVIARFPDAEALIINRDGSPRHPLYVEGAVKPIKYQTSINKKYGKHKRRN